jgi:hypothetical protein
LPFQVNMKRSTGPEPVIKTLPNHAKARLHLLTAALLSD